MNLTELSYYVRKYGPLAFLSIVFFSLLGYTIYLLIVTLQPLKTNQVFINPAFGKLELPTISSLPLKKEVSFVLDTLEGVPITATTVAQVKMFKKPKPKLNYIEKIYLIAKSFDFNTSEIKHKRQGERIVFEDEEKFLSIELPSFNFEFYYKPKWILQNLENLSLPEKDPTIQFAKDKLSSLNKYPKDLAQGKNNILLYSYDKNLKKLTITDSVENAIALRIDFFRKEEDIPIITEFYPKANNYLAISFFEDQLIILKGKAAYFPLYEEKRGLYPLISGDTAFEKLTKNQAFFIKLPKSIPNTVYIKKMFLAYYDPAVYTPFMQPFYVFLGKDFVALVPAVKPEYIK